MKDGEVGYDDVGVVDEERTKSSSNTFPTTQIYNFKRQHSVSIKISTHARICHIQMVNEMRFLKIDAP